MCRYPEQFSDTAGCWMTADLPLGWRIDQNGDRFLCLHGSTLLLAARLHHQLGSISMSETVSGFLIQRIRQWGIRRIYGYPGDGINGGIETAIIGMPNV